MYSPGSRAAAGAAVDGAAEGAGVAGACAKADAAPDSSATAKIHLILLFAIIYLELLRRLSYQQSCRAIQKSSHLAIRFASWHSDFTHQRLLHAQCSKVLPMVCFQPSRGFFP